MTLTKKHFIAIAEIIKRNHNGILMAMPSFLDDLSNYFKEENSQFDTDKFKEACL